MKTICADFSDCLSTSTRACTAGLRPKPTCSNIFASAHLRFTRWCSRCAATTGVFGFLYFGMVDTAAPVTVFVAIVLSLIPHDMQYGPQAALIAEAFTPRLRYSGASLGYQLASVIAGGPAPLIATALFASFHSGYAISIYIAACAVVSLVATAMMPDYTGKDISMEYDD